MADRLRQAREAAETFANAIERYRAASDALGQALAEDEFAELQADLAEPIDPDTLRDRQKRRVRNYLGTSALAALRPDPEYRQNGFSRDFIMETVLREESDIDEARLGALDLAQLLEVDEDEATLARGAAEAFARMAPGAALLAPDSNHQFNLDQSFAALAAQSAAFRGTPRRRSSEALKRRAEQARLAREEAYPAWLRLRDALAAAGLIDDGDGAGKRRDAVAGTGPDTPSGAGPSHLHEKEPIMAEHIDDSCCDRIVDAISRLQEGAGGFAGAAPGALPASAFGTMLEQQIYASIGLPSLTSETAFGSGTAALTSKLLSGLDRAILRSQDGEIVRYVFNPSRARAAAPLDGGEAQGAQAVVAEAAGNLRPAILRAVHTLRPEICTCSEEEIEDIKHDIGEALDLLVQELHSRTGVFGDWALTLLSRVAGDVASLIALYGIGFPPPDCFDRVNRLLQEHAVSEIPWPFHDTMGEIDCDIGILDREANEQAVATIFEHLASLADLIHDLITRSQGATLARLRAQVEAIPAAVMDARTALARAGISETDLKATFHPTGSGREPSIIRSIELGRLFDWIESAANTWRAELLEETLTLRNLRWIRDTIHVQYRALCSSLPDEADKHGSPPDHFPTINPNRYALGLRQIAELGRRLRDALLLARQLHDAANQSLAGRRAPSRTAIYAGERPQSPGEGANR